MAEAIERTWSRPVVAVSTTSKNNFVERRAERRSLMRIFDRKEARSFAVG